MNETLNQLYSRKSVRVFEDRPISNEDKSAILQAAFMAPTAGCQQLYTIIDITDQSLRDKLADSCDHQPFIAASKMTLIFCADCQKWYDAFDAADCAPRVPGAGDFLLAVTDAMAAAQNAVTAAESLGIGSCYIGDIMENYEYHKALLSLPDYVFPAAMLVFGYPTEQQKNRIKLTRCTPDLIVHENGYHRLDSAALRRLLEPRAGQTDYQDWIRAFCKRKYNSDFAREMSRSVAEFLKIFDQK